MGCQKQQPFSLNSALSGHLGCLLSPEGPAQLVIIHLWFALPVAPEASHLIWIFDDKLPVLSLLPSDDMVELFLLPQLQDEVPQLDLPGAQGRLGFVGPVEEGQAWGREGSVSASSIAAGAWVGDLA